MTRPLSVAVKMKDEYRKSTKYNHDEFKTDFGQVPCGCAVELKLINVNDVEETFHIATLVHLHYKLEEIQPDPKAPDEFLRDDNFTGWRPHLVFINTVAQQWEEDSVVFRINRNRGIVWASIMNTFYINESLELETFPFDRQLFRVGFKSADAALDVWSIETDILDFPESTVEEENYAPYLVSCELNTWKMVGITVSVATEDPDPVSLTGDEFNVTIMAERDPIFFLKNYMFVLYLIVATAACNLSIPPTDVNGRMQLSLTILLTAVAFKFSLSQSTPKVGYSSYMDTYVLIAFIFMMISIIENVIVTPRFHCINYGFAWTSSTQCRLEKSGLLPAGFDPITYDDNNRFGDMDWWSGFDTYFQIGYFLAWTGIFLVVAFASYFPSLVRISWKDVLDGQIGETEDTIKRCIYVQDADGEYEGQLRAPKALADARL